ncbi:MAG: response regulator [Planctomycetaceae bacterium]|nr:response regulator [Planctomycetaceae bacterium]
MQKTIFVVDDSGTNLSMAEEALEKQYRVITFSAATRMFTVLEKVKPDLILLDIEMPEIDGYEAMKRLKASELHSAIPVIFLTSLADDANEAYGIELGAVDFITKPFSKPVLLNRIKYHLHVDELIRERTEQLVRLQSGIVFTLADIVENRDANTGGHIERTTVYIEILIKALMERKVYLEEMRTWNLEAVISSARLHDVGKISIPDTILNKPGKLTEAEFTIMKTHALEGERIIDQIVSRTGNEVFLHNAKLFAGYHHERWDGNGYPYSLEGTNIPLQGRIMAIVDVYDALISERPYKKPFTHEEAIGIIMESTGKQFDPSIAEVFYEVKDQFKAVASQ